MKKFLKYVHPNSQIIEMAKQKTLFDALKQICVLDSEIRKLDLKNPDFKLVLKYPRNEFKADILSLVKDLQESDRTKIWNHFGFEITANSNGQMVMSGYPDLFADVENLFVSKNNDCKIISQKIEKCVKKFVCENCILPDKKFISQNFANILNDIFSVLPELYTIVGKEQHKTHHYTVDVHTLAVLKECICNPCFEQLKDEEKQTLVLTVLLHDITKEEYSIDKTHPVESSSDAYYILEKLGLPESQHMDICQLIKNHDMLEQCNKGAFDSKTGCRLPISEEEQNKKIQKYAREFFKGRTCELAIMLTKADLLGVTRDGSFYKKYGAELEKVGKKLRQEIDNTH